MDARAPAAPQKEASRTLRPACSSPLAAGVFRGGTASQRSCRHRKRDGNLDPTRACGATSIRSKSASLRRTAFQATAIGRATRGSRIRVGTDLKHRPRPPPTRRARTRWPRSRTGGRSSLRPGSRQGIDTGNTSRCGCRGACRCGRGRSSERTSAGSCGCSGHTSCSASGAACAERRGRTGDRTAGLRQEFLVQAPQRSPALERYGALAALR